MNSPTSINPYSTVQVRRANRRVFLTIEPNDDPVKPYLLLLVATNGFEDQAAFSTFEEADTQLRRHERRLLNGEMDLVLMPHVSSLMH